MPPLEPGSRPPASALICETDPKSPAAENYRTLRTNLQFAALSKGPQALLVTSASPGEGKTTTVGNLGVILAQAGQRVCLIDADLRRPGLHRLFGVSNATGLTTALVQEKALEEVAQPTRVAGLDLVTSGPVPPNPAELLASKQMQRFLELAAATHDVVILDSPPVLAVSDASVLASRVDGVVLVIRARATPQDAVRRAAAQIEGVQGKVLGVLLNAVDLKRDGYYYRYYTDSSVYGAEPPTKPRR